MSIIVITGASSGFGGLAARALARAGHTVYAGMRDTGGRNAPQVAAVAAYASIVVPGAFTRGTNHFAHSGRPADQAVVAAYNERYAGLMDQVGQRLAELEPPDADVQAVADAIVAVVDAPAGKRPFRVHVDPVDDGAAVVSAVADRVRAEFLRRIGLGDLLAAHAS